MNTAARRAIGAAELLLGLATLGRPLRTARTITAGRAEVPDPRIVRVLGARQFVQGTVMVAYPTRGVFAIAALVDLTHAASLLPVIAVSRRYRLAALVSAVLAGAFAATAAGSAQVQ